MNRNRLNLVLLAAAAGLGVGVYVASRPEAPAAPLTALTADLVTRIALAHPGRPALQLEKGPAGAWRMTAPFAAEIDPFEVNALLALASAETRQAVSGGDLANFGLDPPAYTLTLNDTAIAVGGVEPLSYNRYVKVGDAVSLIDDPPSAALDADYGDLVAKDLIPAGSELVAIEVPGLGLTKGEKGWSATPADPRASADAIQAFVDGWKKARSMWNETASDGTVKGPAVALTLAGGEVRRYVIVATEPQLKLHRAEMGVTYVLSKALADTLLKLQEPKAAEPEKPETPAN